MATSITLDDLKADLARLDREREALIVLISSRNGEHTEKQKPLNQNVKTSSKNSNIRTNVVNAVIGLIQNKANGKIKNSEIMDYIEENHIDLGKNPKKTTALGAILAQEVKKKRNPRLRRVKIGVYALK